MQVLWGVKNIYFKTLKIYFFSITIKIKFLKLKVNILKTLPRLLSIFTLFFTLMFSSTSSAEWTEVAVTSGDTFYVDFERTRKHDGYVYFWELIDFLKPLHGTLSAKRYFQGDCKLFRSRDLSFSFHKEPMGGGTGQVLEPKGEQANWIYPTPNSVNETILKKICSR